MTKKEIKTKKIETKEIKEKKGTCENCNGTGKHSDSNRPCTFCKGSGKE